jgi:hypothetical protein
VAAEERKMLKRMLVIGAAASVFVVIIYIVVKRWFRDRIGTYASDKRNEQAAVAAYVGQAFSNPDDTSYQPPMEMT